MDRTTALERLRATVTAGRPVIGGGAGTGISAKSSEAGGIDLIIIYNSGRYRMAGRGSLAGLMRSEERRVGEEWRAAGWPERRAARAGHAEGGRARGAIQAAQVASPE